MRKVSFMLSFWINTAINLKKNNGINIIFTNTMGSSIIFKIP